MKISFDWFRKIRGGIGKITSFGKGLFRRLSFITSLFKFFNSFRTKIMLIFLAVAIIPSIVAGIISSNGTRSAIINKVGYFSVQKTAQSVNHLDLKLKEYRNANLQLTTDQDLRQALMELVIFEDSQAITDQTSKIDGFFQKYLSQDKTVKHIIFLTNSGANKADVVSGEATPVFSVDQLREAKLLQSIDELYWGSATAIGENIKDLVIANVVKNGEGKKIGVLLTVISEEALYDLVNPAQNQKEINNRYILIDKQGQTLSAPLKNSIGKNIFQTGMKAKKLEGLLSGKKAVNFELGAMDNQAVLISYQKLETLDWYLVNIEATDTLFQGVRLISILIYITGLIFLGLGIYAVIRVSNQMSVPIQTMMTAMKQAEDGDFSTRVSISTRDEFERLGEGFNHMFDRISQLVIDTQTVATRTMEQMALLEDGSVQSAKTAENVASAMAEISKGTIEQTNEADQAARKMGELAENIEEVVTKAAGVEIITDTTKELSSRSKETITNLINKAKESTNITYTVIKDIEDLNTSAVEIGNITDIIADIAEKTNLLALNAAIEAARAGEAGRGFAVVAKEVNKLAAQSQHAAQAIEDLLQVIRSKSGSSAKNADRAHLIVEEQAEAVQLAENAFEEIVRSMDEVISKMTEMSHLIQKVNSFKDQTLQSIMNISAVSQETAASAEQVTASSQEQTAIANQVRISAEELRALAESLVALVEKFKVNAP